MTVCMTSTMELVSQSKMVFKSYYITSHINISDRLDYKKHIRLCSSKNLF